MEEDYQQISDFEKVLPFNLWFKCYKIISGDLLYWVSQDSFTKSDLGIFKFSMEKNLPYKKAYVVSADDSSGDFYNDERHGNGFFISLEDDCEDNYLHEDDFDSQNISGKLTESKTGDLWIICEDFMNENPDAPVESLANEIMIYYDVSPDCALGLAQDYLAIREDGGFDY
jgi:hypothetical protein